MVSAQHHIHRRAALVHEQMALAWERVKHEMSEEEFFGDQNPYYQLLDRLYAEEYPLSVLMASSDLVLHAEGPAAKDAMPDIHAINWLIGSAEKQLRALAKAMFDLSQTARNSLAKSLDLRLTGFAPGSIYAGLRVEPPADSMLYGHGFDEPVFQAIRSAIRQLPIIPSFVREDDLDPGLYEAMPDPAQRDAGLTAAFQLAPTGKLGIHTLEMFVPGEKPSELSQRERVVIRDALKKPVLRKSIVGSFVGELREIDLDKTRFHLRNISGVGSLRCILPEVTAALARPLLGRLVKVDGVYETDETNRPRLMLVESVTSVDRPEQTEADF